MIEVEGSSSRAYRSILAPLKLVYSHKLLVAIPVIAGVGLALMLYRATPARYFAQAVIALDVRSTAVIPTTAVISRLPQENPVLRTELDIIASRSMAEAVLARLDAKVLSHLGEMLETPGLRTRVLLALQDLRSLVTKGADEASPPSPSPSAALDPISGSALVDLLRSQLQVSNDGRSYTIFLNFTASDPNAAATVVNTFAEAYFDYQKDLKIAATRNASEWLGQKVEELQKKVEESEKKVGDLRRSARLLKTTGPSLVEQRFAALNAEIARASSDRAQAEAKLETARELARTPQRLATLSDVAKEPLVCFSLRDKLADFERSRIQLEKTGATDSPGLPALAVQSSAISDQIDVELQRILKSLESDVVVGKRREAELQAALQKAIRDAVSENEDGIRLDQLEREASATRAIYEAFLNRYKQTIEQEGFVAPEASLITQATAPSVPTSPRLFAMLAAGLAGGLGLGLLLVFLRETLDNRVRSGEALEAATGIAILGLVPQRRWWRWILPASSRIDDLNFGQSIRKIQATINLSRRLKRAQAIAITSAKPGDGKTTLAIAIARSLAHAGKRTLLVDCDVHKKGRSYLSLASTGPTLADYFAGNAALEDAVAKDPESPADILLTTERGDASQFENRLVDLLTLLRARYDVILLDTPPVLTFADAATVSALADGVLLVVRWRSTTYEAAALAVRELDLCNVQVSGIVLNGTSRGRKVRYGSLSPKGVLQPQEEARPVHQLYA